MKRQTPILASICAWSELKAHARSQQRTIVLVIPILWGLCLQGCAAPNNTTKDASESMNMNDQESRLADPSQASLAWRLAASLGDSEALELGVLPLERLPLKDTSWLGYPADLKAVSDHELVAEFLQEVVAWGLDCAERAVLLCEQREPGGTLLHEALAAGRACLDPSLDGVKALHAASDRAYPLALKAEEAAGTDDTPPSMAAGAASSAALAGGWFADLNAGERLGARLAPQSAVSAAFCAWRALGPEEAGWQRQRLCDYLTGRRSAGP